MERLSLVSLLLWEPSTVNVIAANGWKCPGGVSAGQINPFMIQANYCTQPTALVVILLSAPTIFNMKIDNLGSRSDSTWRMEHSGFKQVYQNTISTSFDVFLPTFLVVGVLFLKWSFKLLRFVWVDILCELLVNYYSSPHDRPGWWYWWWLSSFPRRENMFLLAWHGQQTGTWPGANRLERSLSYQDRPVIY